MSGLRRLSVMMGCENVGPAPDLNVGGSRAADQSRTSACHLGPAGGVSAAWRVRLVADGGGLENR